MSKSQAENFENNLLKLINNQNNIYDLISEYMNEKSYGTFRIFSKRLKELNKRLFNEKSISEEEYKKINNAIKDWFYQYTQDNNLTDFSNEWWPKT